MANTTNDPRAVSSYPHNPCPQCDGRRYHWNYCPRLNPGFQESDTIDLETTRLLMDAYNALSAVLHDIRSKDQALPTTAPNIVTPAYRLRGDIWNILHP